MRAEEISEAPKLAEFLVDFSPKTDPLSFLLNEHLLDPKSWDPKYAAGLLFCNNPAAALPRRCGIKIVRYETREEDPERDHLKETKSIEGPLYDLIHQAMDEIKKMLSNVNIWTVNGFEKVNYPPETLWEILVNSVIHRDYSISDDVQILVFNDRVEVKSPGRFPANINKENILRERFCRNPKIVRTLGRYRNPPNRDMGEGLDTAFNKMKEWKLRSPIIEEEGNYVLVTIPHTPLAKPEETVIEFLIVNNEITNRQARDLTGIRSENEMKNVFYRLRDADKIERVPDKRSTASAWRIKK